MYQNVMSAHKKTDHVKIKTMNITPDIIVPALQTILENSISYIPRLIAAVLLFIVGLKTQPFFSNWLAHFFETHDYDESLEKFLYSLFGIVYKVAVVLITVSIAGIETASIVAALGAAGFAVGLALQGSMSNFASGILILTLKPFKVGEYIEVSSFSGVVNKIEIFNTIVLTLDNKTIIIPNSELTNTVVTNYSRQKNRRIELSIGVGYDSDIKKTKKILEKVIKKQGDSILNTEKYATTIFVSALGDSAILISVYAWCKATDYFSLKSTLLEDIKTSLDAAQIDIPYPTMTIQKA